MTRGAAANAILDAGRSKKRLSPSPYPLLALFILLRLVHSFRLSSAFSVRHSATRTLYLSRSFASARAFPSHSPFLLSFHPFSFFPYPLPTPGPHSAAICRRQPSLSFPSSLPFSSSSLLLLLPLSHRFLALCTPNALYTPHILFTPAVFADPTQVTPATMPSSFSSRLIPRDRQMMIKKAPLRVRTTPRRSTPLPDTPLSTMLPVPQPPDPRAFFPIFLRSLRSACASFSGLSFSSDLFAIFSFIGPES